MKALLKRLTRRFYSAELVPIDELWSYRFAQSIFWQWRYSSMLWERYARELHSKHPTEESFETWFWKQPAEEKQMMRKYGVPVAAWEKGKTRATVMFIEEAEALLSTPDLPPAQADKLRAEVARLKQGSSTLSTYRSVQDYLSTP